MKTMYTVYLLKRDEQVVYMGQSQNPPGAPAASRANRASTSATQV